MKTSIRLLTSGLAAVLLSMAAHAATVTWGAPSNITAASDIISTGLTSLAGANFGVRTSGGTTPANIIVNNGSVDVDFARVNTGQSILLANGITVAASSSWINFAFNNSNSSMTGNYGVVLDTNLGLEPPDSPSSATITLSGLNIGTQYQIQFFADSTGTNSQTIDGVSSMNSLSGRFVTGTFTADATSQALNVAVVSGGFAVANALTIGTVSGGGPDVTPPDWTATWPQVDPLSTTSLTVRTKTNEAGTAYYVVLPDGATAPSAAQVKAGQDSSNAPVSASGSLALTANTESTAPVASLSPGTAYDVYFVAEDAVPNLQVSPVKVDASTLAPDTTAPDWIATWPQVNPLSTTSLTVRAQTNETGTAYYVVLADGATAPSAAQVKAGQDSSNAAAPASGSLALTANTEATGPVGSLSPGTAYDVYFVAEDAVPNLQASPVKVDASTLAPDVTPPDWIATWPQAGQLSPTSITVRAQTNETGTAYYVVLADGATAPSAAQVKAGNDSSNAAATASGNLALTANIEATSPVTGLTADTSYDVYFIAQDAVPNLQATPVLVNVTLVSPAVVTWGTWTDVANETAIQKPGGYTYGGVNFNGSTTTIDGLVFTGIAQNASGVANGVTVGSTGFAFQSTGNNSNVSSAVGSPQTWATVLDRVIGDFDNSATIDLTGLTPGTDYTVQFFSSTPDANLNQTTTITSGGVESPAFGTHSGGQTRYIIASFTANSASQSFSINGAEPTFGALVIGVEASNTFANWIAGYSGLNGLTGFGDDADFDGLDNGLENFLGTAPNAGNAGLTAGTLSGNVFTFTHPQNATPASDVSAPVYTWSTDLVSWNASNASSGGITVVLVPDTDNPSAGTTTVMATVTGTVPPKLFLRLSVSQD